jgi:hypothetical protein
MDSTVARIRAKVKAQVVDEPAHADGAVALDDMKPRRSAAGRIASRRANVILFAGVSLAFCRVEGVELAVMVWCRGL